MSGMDEIKVSLKEDALAAKLSGFGLLCSLVYLCFETDVDYTLPHLIDLLVIVYNIYRLGVATHL